MAGKRLREGPEDSEGQSDQEKKIKPSPSFANVIRDAMIARSFQSFFLKLEPMLRRVVHEEVERGLVQGTRSLQRSPQRHIQAIEPSPLCLTFGKPLHTPIFTGTRIVDEGFNPLKVFLLDASGGITPLPSSIKVEIVVIDGAFPSDERDDWTSSEFEMNIVKERAGKRPLIVGDVTVTLKECVGCINDLMFTDNSSWIKSRHFRIGARIAPGCCQGLRIREAMTAPFMVKDHRGELYKKHYPPALNDEVWRLEKIGKEGAFHKKLSQEGISTVQDFLKMWTIDTIHLRKILGPGMSDRMWEVTIGHAKTCELGTKLYLHRRPPSVIVLNPICQVVGIALDGGLLCSPRNLVGQQKAAVEQMALEAYRQWSSLEEVDQLYFCSTTLPPNGTMQQALTEQPAVRFLTDQDVATAQNYRTNGFVMGESFRIILSISTVVLDGFRTREVHPVQ